MDICEIKIMFKLHKGEAEYNANLIENVENGIQHPVLLFMQQEYPLTEPEVAEGIKIKERYGICKSCEQFNDTFKKCQVCHCFMPLKTQFKMFKCPKGKW
jgi:hypothetical protein